MNTIGARMEQIIASVGGESITHKRLLARSAGRYLEEAVELALSLGLEPNDLLGHVVDALHNEARKASVYPSELRTEPSQAERMVELADNYIMQDYLRHLAGVSLVQLATAVAEKADKLDGLAQRDEMKVVDGLMYWKVSRP